jgi:hypothetical protein
LKKTPIGIILLGALVFIVALIALIVGISTLLPGTPLDIVWNIKNSFPPDFRTTMIGKVFGSFILILGMVMMASVYGLIKGSKIAWWAIVIIFTVNLVGDLVSVILGKGIDNVIGIVIVGVLLIYMTRPSVRSYFNKK